MRFGTGVLADLPGLHPAGGGLADAAVGKRDVNALLPVDESVADSPVEAELFPDFLGGAVGVVVSVTILWKIQI